MFGKLDKTLLSFLREIHVASQINLEKTTYIGK